MERGYAKVKRVWQAGDKVTLYFPMPVERTAAHPEVRINAGRVALQRGPIVYCLEEVDNGPVLTDIALPLEPEFETSFEPELLGGVTVIKADAYRSSSDYDDRGSTAPLPAHRSRFRSLPSRITPGTTGAAVRCLFGYVKIVVEERF